MSRAFYLTTQEMNILLYRKRISGIIIFDELKKKTVSEDDIKRALESLINNGYLVPGDEAFNLNDELETVFEILEKCRYGFRIRAMKDRENARCLYVSDGKSVLIRLDEHSSDLIRLELLDGHSAVLMLMDSDYMPEPSNMQYIDEKSDIDPGQLEDEFMNEDSRMLIERYERGSSMPDKYILIKEGIDRDYIYAESKGVVKKRSYTKEGFIEELLEDTDGIG